MSKLSRNKVLTRLRRRRARARRACDGPLTVDLCWNIRAVDQDLLKRFMSVVVGTDWFLVTDMSHLNDFAFAYEPDGILDVIEHEFGVRLPHTDFYLWEALRELSGSVTQGAQMTIAVEPHKRTVRIVRRSPNGMAPGF